jgi:hypothetical protein
VLPSYIDLLLLLPFMGPLVAVVMVDGWGDTPLMAAALLNLPLLLVLLGTAPHPVSDVLLQ